MNVHHSYSSEAADFDSRGNCVFSFVGEMAYVVVGGSRWGRLKGVLGDS